MSTRIPGFKGEYLWELDIAEKQLLALAEAITPERYGWRPEGARSVATSVGLSKCRRRGPLCAIQQETF